MEFLNFTKFTEFLNSQDSIQFSHLHQILFNLPISINQIHKIQFPKLESINEIRFNQRNSNQFTKINSIHEIRFNSENKMQFTKLDSMHIMEFDLILEIQSFNDRLKLSPSQTSISIARYELVRIEVCLRKQLYRTISHDASCDVARVLNFIL